MKFETYHRSPIYGARGLEVGVEGREDVGVKVDVVGGKERRAALKKARRRRLFQPSSFLPPARHALPAPSLPLFLHHGRPQPR